METRSIRLPGPNHPLAIEPNFARVTVSVAGRIVADTRRALTLNAYDANTRSDVAHYAEGILYTHDDERQDSRHS